MSTLFRLGNKSLWDMGSDKIVSMMIGSLSIPIGSQMSRLRQVTKQIIVYLSTLSLGIITFLKNFSILHFKGWQETLIFEQSHK